MRSKLAADRKRCDFEKTAYSVHAFLKVLNSGASRSQVLEEKCDGIEDEASARHGDGSRDGEEPLQFGERQFKAYNSALDGNSGKRKERPALSEVTSNVTSVL